MERNCDACGRTYEAKSKRSQFCADPECKRARARLRKRAQRSEHRDAEHAGGKVIAFPGNEGPLEPLTVEAVTRAKLAAVGRLDHPAGVNALVLARRLDSANSDFSLELGGAVASLSKQHLAALAEALRGAEGQEDEVDRLRARRASRRNGA